MLGDTGTILELIGMGVPLYSARGLTQILTPISAITNQRRTVNGELVNLGYEQFQKYISKITCTDQRAPAIDGIWPGVELEVHCVHELSYPVSGLRTRPEVSGSSYEEGGFVFYRPILYMMVTSFINQKDEWPGDVQWELDLEEI